MLVSLALVLAIIGALVGGYYFAMRPVTLRVAVGPANSDDLKVVQMLSQAFAQSKGVVNQDHEWLNVTDLKGPPYYFDAAQEATLKSAVADLDTALDAIDMTFISRIIGLA